MIWGERRGGAMGDGATRGTEHCVVSIDRPVCEAGALNGRMRGVWVYGRGRGCGVESMRFFPEAALVAPWVVL